MLQPKYEILVDLLERRLFRVPIGARFFNEIL